MAEWVIGLIEQHGYVAIALLMCAENLFPPLPSELIMPFAGFVAARGELQGPGVVAAGALGSLLGAYPWYLAGRWLSVERLKRWAERHGAWLTLSPGDVDRADAWFDRRGPVVLVFGRLVPALRSVIALPAGLSGMAVLPFSLWTLVGTTLWSGALAAAGYALESRYTQIAAWMNPVSTAIVVLLVVLYLVRLIRQRRTARSPRPAAPAPDRSPPRSP